MALTLEDKKAVVAEVASVAKDALSAVAADYRGLSVSQMDELRKRARNTGVYMRVVRNSLARLAMEGTEFECMQDSLVGSLVLAFSKEEPGAAARLIHDFMKECDNLSVRSLAIGGELHGPEQLAAVAKLPTRDEALATLMSVMNAPITKFVRTLNEPTSQAVRCFAAVRDQKQSA